MPVVTVAGETSEIVKTGNHSNVMSHIQTSFMSLTLGCRNVIARVLVCLIAFVCVCVLVSILRFLGNPITDISLTGNCYMLSLTLLHALHVMLWFNPILLLEFFLNRRRLSIGKETFPLQAYNMRHSNF